MSTFPQLNTRPSSLSQNNSNTQGMPSSVSPREPSGEDPTVPPPSSLTLEKQMHKSIMISWSPAPLPVYQQHQQQSGYHTVESYRVFVDNVLKWTSGASERCGALIEGIDLTVCHRVSVRTRTGKPASIAKKQSGNTFKSIFRRDLWYSFTRFNLDMFWLNITVLLI